MKKDLLFLVLIFLSYLLFPPIQIYAFNVKNVFFVIFIIAFINFIGNLLLKHFGARSLILLGITGGLVSSTAVTLSMSSLVKENPKIIKGASGAIASATWMRNIRVLFLVLLFNILAIKKLVFYIFIPTFIFWILTMVFLKYKTESKAEIRSDTIIKESIFFGLIYIVVKTALKFLHSILGDIGIYLTAFLTGFTDVDALTISLCTSNLQIDVIAKGIALAIFSNDLIKWAYTFLGGKNFAKETWKILILPNLPILPLIIFY